MKLGSPAPDVEPGGPCISLNDTGVACKPEQVGVLIHREAKESRNREATGNSGDREVEKLTARAEKQTEREAKLSPILRKNVSEMNVDAW